MFKNFWMVKVFFFSVPFEWKTSFKLSAVRKKFPVAHQRSELDPTSWGILPPLLCQVLCKGSRGACGEMGSLSMLFFSIEHKRKLQKIYYTHSLSQLEVERKLPHCSLSISTTNNGMGTRRENFFFADKKLQYIIRSPAVSGRGGVDWQPGLMWLMRMLQQRHWWLSSFVICCSCTRRCQRQCYLWSLQYSRREQQLSWCMGKEMSMTGNAA